MKKFILEITIAITLIYMSGFLLYRIDIPFGIAKRIHNIEEKIEIVNLGTSHGSAFDYTDCTLNGKKIYRAGNTLYYDLQNYIFLCNKNYLSKDAIVIIPISYYVFGLDENRTDLFPDDSFVNDFYYYLPKEQIFSYSEDKKASLTVLTIQENFYKLIKSKIIKNSRDITVTDSELKKHAIARVKYHKKLSGYSSKQKNQNYLESLIKEVIKNKHIPILVSTPYHYSYNEGFGKKWLNENYFNIMKNLSTKYNITYLDYSHDNRLCFKTDYFSDSDHLNKEGSRIFSSIIFHDLQKKITRTHNNLYSK